MKNFTRLWQVLMIVLLSSGLLVGQTQKTEMTKTEKIQTEIVVTNPDLQVTAQDYGIKGDETSKKYLGQKEENEKSGQKENAYPERMLPVYANVPTALANQKPWEPVVTDVGFLAEDFGSGDFTANGWTFDPAQGNWFVYGSDGNPAPAAIFYWDPGTTNYSNALVSAAYDVTSVTLLSLGFDIFLNNYSTASVENMDVEVWDGAAWQLVQHYDNQGGSIAWTPAVFDVSTYINSAFQVRFVASGANTFNLNWWLVDNIEIYETPTTPVLDVSPGDPFSFGFCGVGVSETQTFTLSNVGVGTLNISSVTLTGTLDFSMTDLNTYPIGLPPSITVDVTFSPTSLGEKSAYLTITDDLTETVTVINISGEGVPVPANNDCANATPIPILPATVNGTTIGATASCFPEAEVWYEVDLPYCQNNLMVSFCPTPENMGQDIANIYPYIFTSCDCGDFQLYDVIDWESCASGSAPYMEYVIPGPTTIFLPVCISGDGATWDWDFQFDVDVADVTPSVPDCGNTNAGNLIPTGVWQQENYLLGDSYYWTFDATVGTTYAFSSCASGEDTYLRLYDDCYNVIASNDDNGPYCAETSASLDWQCLADGTYFISLAHFSCDPLENDSYLEYKFSLCSPPINTATQILSTTNASSSWDAGGTETMWNIEWGPQGYAFGTGTPASVSAMLYDYGDVLTEGTAYDWYIQSDCGGELSAWIGPMTFATFNANDLCANATPVGEVTDLPFSTLSATADGYAPSCGGTTAPLDIWYLYTPSSDGIATFDLCGSDYDTRIAIWEACPDGVITDVACNDDDCGIQSRVSYPVVTTSSYYVQVGGYNAAIGSGDLTIALGPPNDECIDAVPVPNTFPYMTTGTTIGATEDCPTLLTGYGLVWYEIPIENAYNCIQIDYCGTVGMANALIILMDDCLCDDYILADYTVWEDCPDPALYLEYYNIPGGPGQTLLLPVYAQDEFGSGIDFTLNINVTLSSTSAVTPASITVNLPAGSTANDAIDIQNLGAVCNIAYGAQVVYPAGVVHLDEGFESGTFPPTGWSVVNNGGTCDWYDQDALEGGGADAEGNATGGTGNFADADSDNCGSGATMDTELLTPVMDLSGAASATLTFYHYFYDASWDPDVADVDVSTDGGTTWSNLLSFGGATSSGLQSVALPVGSATTMIRFHYIAPDWDWFWQVDDAFVESFSTPTGWLTVDGAETTSGAVMGGNTGMVDVGVDATTLIEGTYNAQVEVYTNDPPAGNMTPVDITVNVEAVVEILKPSVNTIWQQGSYYEILWYGPFDDSENVSIRLFKGGVYHSAIAFSTINDGKFIWTLPAGLPVGCDYQIRIYRSADPAVEDYSVDFCVGTPLVTFTNPKVTNITWAQGEYNPIKWTSVLGPTEQIRLQLWNAEGLYSTLAFTTDNDGIFNWVTPPTIDDGCGYYFKIYLLSDPQQFGVSREICFGEPTIDVITPSLLATWLEGSFYGITWNSTLPPEDDVNIQLYQDGAYVTNLAFVTDNDGLFIWTVPAGLYGEACDYAIRVGSNSSSSDFGFSKEFCIAPPAASKDKAVTMDTQMEVSIIPNPATHEIAIDASNLVGDDLKFTIYDSYGKMILQKECADFDYRHVEKIRISDLPTGMYLVLVMNDGKMVQKKFLKQ